MNPSTQITEEQRNELYNQLAQLMLTAVEAGSLPYEEMQEPSQFILDTLDTLSINEEVSLFLDNLADKWPLFQGAAGSYQAQQVEAADNQQIAQAQQQIQQLI